MMGKVHHIVLASLDFDGMESFWMLAVDQGHWQSELDANVVGLDCWSAAYSYSQSSCERNALSEEAAELCHFMRGMRIILIFLMDLSRLS